MTFEMNLNPTPFEKISKRNKDIEMRLFTDERKKIQVGDYIKFKNNVSGETLQVKVNGIYPFKTFEELYKFFPKHRLGYSNDEAANYQDMYEYYSKEAIEKYGVVGFKIEVI